MKFLLPRSLQEKKSKYKKRKKKDSPSNRRRNQRRKEEFLKRKSAGSSGEAEIVVKETPEHLKTFKCDQCEMSFNTDNGLKIHKGKTHKCSLPPSPEKLLCSIERVVEKEISPVKESTREEEPVTEEEGEEGPHLHVEEPVPMVKEDLEPYKLEFNDYRKWDTGDIPRSSMRVQLPKPPPMTVKHDNYGLGEFVKTHPFGNLSFMKGPRSHQYTFREGGRELYFLDPCP